MELERFGMWESISVWVDYTHPEHAQQHLVNKFQHEDELEKMGGHPMIKSEPEGDKVKFTIDFSGIDWEKAAETVGGDCDLLVVLGGRIPDQKKEDILVLNDQIESDLEELVHQLGQEWLDNKLSQEDIAKAILNLKWDEWTQLGMLDIYLMVNHPQLPGRYYIWREDKD